MAKTLTFELRVRSYELDSFRHVNNAVFLQYLEAARCDYMNQVGLSINDFHVWNAVPIVTSANLEYRSPLAADDEVVVHGEVVDMKRARFAIKYRMVRKHDRSPVLLARTEFVFVNSDGRPVAIPEPFRRAFGD